MAHKDWLCRSTELHLVFIIFTIILTLVAYHFFANRPGRMSRLSVLETRYCAANLVPSRTGARTTKIYTYKPYDSFTPDILIRTRSGEYKVAAAALDTKCEEGDWISKRLVEELDLIDCIYYDHKPPRLVTATGEGVESCGSIDLNWKLAPNKNRIYRGKFFILSDVRHLDVILGQTTIHKEDILSVHRTSLLATLTPYTSLTKSDKAAMQALEAQQQQDKKDLETRRQATQQQQSPIQSLNQQR